MNRASNSSSSEILRSRGGLTSGVEYSGSAQLGQETRDTALGTADFTDEVKILLSDDSGTSLG